MTALSGCSRSEILPFPGSEEPKHDKAWLRDTFPRVAVEASLPVVKGSGCYTLARGKHGKVVSARQVAIDAPVVIKAEEPGDGRVYYERQVHAYVTAHKIPNVLPLLATAEGPRKVYSVLPRARPLPKKMTLPEVQHVMDGLLTGLEGLHGIRVYHRDVKRKNTLLDSHNNAQIIDFGKSAVNVDAAQSLIFARADWRKAARVFGLMLSQTEVGPIARLRWEGWWRTVDFLDAKRMRRHSLLGGPGGFFKASHLLCGLPMMSCMALEGVTAREKVYHYFPVPPLPPPSEAAAVVVDGMTHKPG